MPITVTSKFTPLTYDQISKPLIEATEAQQKVEDTYAAAMEKAADVRAKLNAARDTQSYGKADAYYNDLRALSDDIAANGLRPGSRRALTAMRGRYGTDISPIGEAVARKQKLEEQMQQFKLTHPDIITQNDVSTASVDEFVNNPSYSYGNVVDLQDLQNKAAVLTKAIGQAQDALEYDGNLDKFTKIIKETTGFDEAYIEQAIREAKDKTNPDSQNKLREIYRSIYNNTGLDEWGTSADKDKAWNSIELGALAGAGAVKKTATADQVAIRNAEAAEFDRRQQEQYGDGPDSFQDNDGNLWTKAKDKQIAENGAEVYTRLGDDNKWHYALRGDKISKGRYGYQEFDPTKVPMRNVSTGTGSSSSSSGDGLYQWNGSAVPNANTFDMYDYNEPEDVTNDSSVPKVVKNAAKGGGKIYRYKLEGSDDPKDCIYQVVGSSSRTSSSQETPTNPYFTFNSNIVTALGGAATDSIQSDSIQG